MGLLHLWRWRQVNDVKLEGEDVRAHGGQDSHESAKEGGHFCRGLVEDAEAGEGGAEGPEL